jgi:streptogrisin C
MRLKASAGLLILAAAVVALPGTATASPGGAPVGAREPTPQPAVQVTAQLNAALERDLHLSADQTRDRLAAEATAPVAERSLRTELGARFGGAWLSADAHLVIGVTDETAAAAARAAGALPQPVTRSEQQLNQTKAVLDAHYKAAPDGVSGWYVDLPSNSVVVRSTRAQTAQQFAAASGVAASVRVVESAEQPRPLFDLRGGDPYLIGGSRCSVGFAVVGGFVTAGHCAALTSGPITGTNSVAMGTWGGFAFPGDDEAWVRTNANWTPLPQVTGIGPVGGSQEAVVGSSVCRSGSTTGVHCGTIQAKNETVIYPQGTVFGLTRTSACAEPGDSGGSFITGIQAQGVTSGGSGNCTVGGTTFFQPVNEILSTYGLTLITTAWSGWGEVPGAGATLAGPAAATYLGSEYLFVRGTDSRIYVNRLTGSSWTGWAEVPGAGATPNAPSVTVYNGTLRLFVQGTDNHIYANTLSGSSWTGWSEVPGAGATPNGPGATTYNGAVHVFVQGTDSRIYVNVFNGSSWTGWGEVPGAGATPSSPAATVLGTTLRLFVRGTDNRIYANTLNGSSWTGWGEVPGAGATPSGPGANVFGGVLHLFVRGTDNRIYLNSFTP